MPVFIGVFGKPDPAGVELLDKTAVQLGQRFPSHYLVIAGINEKQAAIDKKPGARVHTLPSIPENDSSLIQALDCCIYFPNPQNFYQGVPLDVTRAMACFCPVIGQDFPGVRDVLTDKITGKIFDPKQPNALLDTINWVLNSPRAVAPLVQAANDLVQKHHTMDAMGRDILRIYRLRQVKIDRQIQVKQPWADQRY